MKIAQLSGSPRANVGKKDAKLTRNSGQVPCVLYGSGEQTVLAVTLNHCSPIIVFEIMA